jgi:hypothetical protein
MSDDNELPSGGAGGRSPAEQQQWWFCTKHMRAESAATTTCAGKDLLGPYATKEEASHALDKVKERNAAWDQQD